MNELPLHEGGCLCGAVRYRIEGEPLTSGLCHCASCRRASGAPAVAWLTVHRDRFDWLTGAPFSYRSSPGVLRTFCGQCGTPLTYRRAGEETLDVTTATLDAPQDYPPREDTWPEERLPWFPCLASEAGAARLG
ncbi:GFA family protein [Caldimonas brevitalea]|uniref:CENP-V/GFA domain-containing protein n=1 Tax=Caldimonas brevitalea TaxID=413882 RepID=A0A0G3BUZ1_9BURK|nr:GFA family protein [Caldimonas brevitalea]AKJ31803.1 hypothetical protein AAW51_5112 [Caldimonas brevitalea]